MSDIPCQERPPRYDHTPDHTPTLHGDRGYCKVCLEWDYIAETVAVGYGGVHLGLRWTPCISALEIEARHRRAGQLTTAPQPAPTLTPDEQEAATGNVLKLSGDVWQVHFGEEAGNFSDRADSIIRRLARLLAEPNRRFAAQEFYPPPPGAAPAPHYGRDERSDDRALEECEKRMRELVQEIKDADDAHDTEEADRLRGEFDQLKDHLDGEKAARHRGHKKRCGTLPADENADQALRVGLKKLKDRFRKVGLPKLADHLNKSIGNGSGDWWYAPPPDTSPWHVTRPAPRPEE